MKRLDLHIVDVLPLDRPANRLLMAGVVFLIALLFAPVTVRPLLQRWGQPIRAPAAEAWPAAPPTYAAPTVASAMAPQPLPTPTPLPAPVWRELSYLTTVEFTTSSIVETERRASVILLGDMVTDRLLLRA